MFFKLSSLSQLVVVAAMFMAGTANADRGWAHLNGTNGLITQSCGTCPPSNITGKVALPIDGPINPVDCCAIVDISGPGGRNKQGIYTDICINCRSGNITLSEDLFEQFAPPSATPFFVTWNANNP